MLTVENLKRLHIGPVSFTVQGGACLAITGPSGAGKSLLLRAIVDLDLNAGSISVNAQNRDKSPAPVWRQTVAMLPAESGWWLDRVALHFQNPDEIRTQCTSVGLPPEALDWEVARLSSGERHRLALLRCLQSNPKVLLLDEPTASLDRKTTALVENVLKRQLANGVSIVIVTHDDAQAERLADHTLHLEGGKLT